MDGEPASKRGLPHNEKCVFCNLTEEDTQHLFIGCALVNIIWNSLLKWAGFDQVVQISSQNLRTWWKQALKNMENAGKKKLNSIILSLGRYGGKGTAGCSKMLTNQFRNSLIRYNQKQACGR
jgi:hypothetical protein